jgi:alpha-ketoglutarate-dependent taurine dioxygenase
MRLGQVKPTQIESVLQSDVKIGMLRAGESLPTLVERATGDTVLTTWARANWDWITAALHTSGGVLFRGFGVTDAEEFGRFVRAVSPELLEYKERSTPRTEVGHHIYTSTEYPAHQHIAMHNEFSYAYSWPRKIFFFAETPALSGGETPIADSRQVFRAIPEATRIKFIAHGVMYVRNYGQGIDLTWQVAFQTDSKEAVEEYCRRAPMQFEWLDGDRLRTRQVRPAVARHPVTGEMVWFNQAHLFHVSNLGPEVRASMTAVFSEDELPRNAYFGDGSPIPDSDIDAVRNAYEQATVSFPWIKGDVLALDNTLVAHGRNPYHGPRRILAALTEPYSSPDTPVTTSN